MKKTESTSLELTHGGWLPMSSSHAGGVNQRSVMPTDVDESRVKQRSVMPADVDESRVEQRSVVPADVDESRVKQRSVMPADVDESRVKQRSVMPTDVDESRVEQRSVMPTDVDESRQVGFSDELNDATERCESDCCTQQTEEDILSESDIQERFMELWYEKGELLVYKAFVTRFPTCARWYDQICGSIPPEIEVEVAASRMFDSHTDMCNRENLFGETANQEHVCCSITDKDYLDNNLNNKEHLYNCSSSTEHLNSGACSKEHDGSAWEESVYSQTTSKEYIDHEIDNKESLYDESVGAEHENSGTNNKEHFFDDKNNEHFHFYKDNSEHLQPSDNDKEILCRGFKLEKPLHKSIGSEQGTHRDSNIEACVHEVTHMKIQLYDNRNECINSDCESKGEVCNIGSNRDCSELYQNGCRAAKLSGAEEVTLNHAVILEADISTNGSFTEIRSFPFQTGSCSDSNDVSFLDVSSVGDSTLQAVLEEGITSCRHSDPENELVAQLLPHEEHCYTSRSCVDHSYTNGADRPSTGGHCPDCLTVDGQDAGEQFCLEELIARLQETHADLKNQIFAYVRETFFQWIRKNPDEEFDVCSLDEHLLAVAIPVMEVEVVNMEFVDEK